MTNLRNIGNFKAVDSKNINLKKSNFTENSILIVLEHSNTRSAFLKLFQGNLGGQFTKIRMQHNLKSNLNPKKSKIYFQVGTIESLEEPKNYLIDLNKRDIEFNISPLTSWETTYISLFFENVYPPLGAGAGHSIYINNCEISSDVEDSQEIPLRLQFREATEFVSKVAFQSMTLKKGSYSFKTEIQKPKGVFKFGLVLKSQLHSYSVDINFQKQDSNVLNIIEDGEFDAYAYVYKETSASLDVHKLSLQSNLDLAHTQHFKSKLCAIIPSHNCAEYIDRAVDSMLAQTVPPCAIYIVDDCSSDNTQEKMEALKQKASRHNVLLSSLRLSSSYGPYFAKNIVLYNMLDHFDYFAMQDADDHSSLDRFEKQLQAFEKSEYTAVYTYGQRLKKGEIQKNRGLDSRRMYATGMFKKEFFLEMGYFEISRFGADDEMYKRSTAISPKKTFVIKEPLYFAEVRDSSLTRTKSFDEDRVTYANTFDQRYTSTKSLERCKTPFYRNPLTPKSILAAQAPVFHQASYPPRFESLKKVLGVVVPILESFNAKLVLCMNNVDSLPKMFSEFADCGNIQFVFPETDLSANGKFLGIEEGINFWIDDDIEYSKEYFIYMCTQLALCPKNTVLCMHGLRGKIAYGRERDVTHFEALTATTQDSYTAGTGVSAAHIESEFVVNALSKISEDPLRGMVDPLFGLICARLGIPVYNIKRDRTMVSAYPQEKQGTSLFDINKKRHKTMENILTLIHDIRNFKSV